MEETSQDLELRNSVLLDQNEYAIYQIISLVSKQFEKHTFQPTENIIKKPLIRILSSPETINLLFLAGLAIRNRLRQ